MFEVGVVVGVAVILWEVGKAVDVGACVGVGVELGVGVCEGETVEGGTVGVGEGIFSPSWFWV